MSLYIRLRNFFLGEIAVEVANDSSNVERHLEVGVPAVDHRQVSIVCRHPRIVSPYVDIWSCAVETILAVESNRIRDFGFRLRSVGHVMRVLVFGVLFETVLTDVIA